MSGVFVKRTIISPHTLGKRPFGQPPGANVWQKLEAKSKGCVGWGSGLSTEGILQMLVKNRPGEVVQAFNPAP